MFQKNHVKQAELLLEKIKDVYFQKYFGEFHKKYGYIGAFNGFYHRYPSQEARWAFLARLGYLEYECGTGRPYYDLMELLRDKTYHIMTTNQDFQFTRVVPEALFALEAMIVKGCKKRKEQE